MNWIEFLGVVVASFFGGGVATAIAQKWLENKFQKKRIRVQLATEKQIEAYEMVYESLMTSSKYLGGFFHTVKMGLNFDLRDLNHTTGIIKKTVDVSTEKSLYLPDSLVSEIDKAYWEIVEYTNQLFHDEIYQVAGKDINLEPYNKALNAFEKLKKTMKDDLETRKI